MFSEKDIEDLIANCIEKRDFEKLESRGLWPLLMYNKFYRQVHLSDYGRLDLVGIGYPSHEQYRGYKKLNIGVIEIKRGEIDYNAFIQAIRYCKGINEFLKKTGWCAEFSTILIGTSIQKSDFCYLSEFMNNLYIFSVKMDLEKGIIFKRECGYNIANADVKISNDIISDIGSLVRDSVRSSINR